MIYLKCFSHYVLTSKRMLLGDKLYIIVLDFCNDYDSIIKILPMYEALWKQLTNIMCNIKIFLVFWGLSLVTDTFLSLFISHSRHNSLKFVYDRGHATF